MRLVLDTNALARVVMSPMGPAAELFQRISTDHLLIISAGMLAVLSGTLAYERVRRIHRLDDADIHRFVDRVAIGSVVVQIPDALPRVVPGDPDDDVVVATAVAGNAAVLCTRNKHLFHQDVIAYCQSRNIEILDDLQLLSVLRTAVRDESNGPVSP